MTNIKLYHYPLSGHSHKARLFLSLLGIETELIEIDLKAGEQKQDTFLKRNCFGQVPVLEDGQNTIADSNAILVYLARTYDKAKQWYPDTALGMAEIQRFLSISANQLVSGPATARLVNVFGAQLDKNHAMHIATALLSTFNNYLGERKWLVGKNASIADIANYTYIAHAPEGDISLEPYPRIRQWLGAIEKIPGFIPMQKTKVGLYAV